MSTTNEFARSKKAPHFRLCSVSCFPAAARCRARGGRGAGPAAAHCVPHEPLWPSNQRAHLLHNGGRTSFSCGSSYRGHVANGIIINNKDYLLDARWIMSSMRDDVIGACSWLDAANKDHPDDDFIWDGNRTKFVKLFCIDTPCISIIFCHNECAIMILGTQELADDLQSQSSPLMT